MGEPFDPYRDALVIETKTIWPDGLDPVEPERRDRIARWLHAHPGEAAELAYVRLHAGFCRQITVTPADVEKVA